MIMVPLSAVMALAACHQVSYLLSIRLQTQQHQRFQDKENEQLSMSITKW